MIVLEISSKLFKILIYYLFYNAYTVLVLLIYDILYCKFVLKSAYKTKLICIVFVNYANMI